MTRSEIHSDEMHGARRMLAALTLAILASIAIAIPVLADTPPTLPRDITIFPERDFVAIDGYQPDIRLRVSVIRAGNVVGTARGRTDGTGFLEVNHPGGVCWDAPVTPDIRPGDRVRVQNTNLGIDDSNRTANVGIDEDDPATDANESGAARIVGDTVIVKGTARDSQGNPIPLRMIEQRIVQPDFRNTPGSDLVRRDIRADVTGGRVDNGNASASGTIAYDAPGSIHWTATYRGLNATERNLAVEGQSRVLSWMAVQGAERAGITIFEHGEIGGPGFGGCPPGPDGFPPLEPPDPPVLYDAITQSYDTSGLISAAGAVRDSPVLNELHEVVVFPERDFVVAEGYGSDLKLEFVVRRPGVGIIGSSRGNTGNGGMFEVNHPGGACWTGQTPDIRPGDIVDVVEFDDSGTADDPTDDSFVGGETQETINVSITEPAFVNTAGNLTVKGTAQDVQGNPIPLRLIEQRIINPALNETRIDRRDIRADNTGGRVDNVPGGSGILRYDAPGSTNWTATYSGLNEEEKRLAVEGQSRLLSWHVANASGDRFGITIFEYGEVGGPGFGGCPQNGDLSLPVNQIPR